MRTTTAMVEPPDLAVEFILAMGDEDPVLEAEHVACRTIRRGSATEGEGTNASDDMLLAGNRFVGNRVGLTSNSNHQEVSVPQQDATIVGNLISANAEPGSLAQVDGAIGLGMSIAAGTRNTVSRNLITSNPSVGWPAVPVTTSHHWGTGSPTT